MPTPAYIAGKDAVLTLNGAVAHATDVTVNWTIGEWDATNLASGGYFTSGTDIQKLEVRGTMFVDGASLPAIPFTGAIVTAVAAVTGWKTFTGEARYIGLDHRVAPRGGMAISFQLNYTGSFTIT